jgi:hypothetical protein
MSDQSTPQGDNPYAPPPAGEQPVPPAPPAPPASGAPLPSADAYQPPAAPTPPSYPGASTQPPAAAPFEPAAPQGTPAKKQTSPQTTSIIALVAGAVSIFLLPYIAGVIGIGMGATALRLGSAAKREGAPVSAGVTAMAVIGIVLGALGIILKFAVDRLL